MSEARTVTLNLDTIEARCREALERAGAASWVAAEVAVAVREAEANGNVICGLYYLQSYCQQLRSGRLKGGVEPVVSRPRAASVEVDAGFGFAQAAFARGLPVAVASARENGFCGLAVSHAHTCTSLGFFTRQIAQAGLIGIGFTNASAVVSPPGGTKAVLGTNPIAMSVPAKGGGLAFQFDQSTSAVALGKITMAAAAGESIPAGWAVDAQGRSTTDPHEAIAGSLVSTGGYKGFGFGLMAEVLAAALTGSVNSLDVKALKSPEGPPHDLGQFYFLVDPETFAGEVFWQRLERLSEAVAAQEGARLPGTNKASVDNVAVPYDLWCIVEALASGD